MASCGCTDGAALLFTPRHSPRSKGKDLKGMFENEQASTTIASTSLTEVVRAPMRKRDLIYKLFAKLRQLLHLGGSGNTEEAAQVLETPRIRKRDLIKEKLFGKGNNEETQATQEPEEERTLRKRDWIREKLFGKPKVQVAA
eukprot:TRINITY_DN2277_c0_g5_i1.p1 TRINITY_DN2277_c0_g5~~TRINITY_DN2277_c0_g5_i1.p1  ORF type:complete len:164 (+),score=36.62 TRINITY_DN2277_c0_g5_i1:68-493(+)